MSIPHLLCVGYDRTLMHSRAMVLRQAGFLVAEAFCLNCVLGLVKTDLIDGLLLCYTIPRGEQRWLIAEVREERQLLPIVCVESQDHDTPHAGCISAPNDPDELLGAVRLALRLP